MCNYGLSIQYIQYLGMEYACMVPPLIEQSLRSVQVWITKMDQKEID